MKTHTIKTDTAELLIIEPPNSWGLVIGEEELLIHDHTKKVFGKTHTFNGHYTLLGKPDEIKEEDVMGLIGEGFDISINKKVFNDYKDESNCYKTAKESLFSLLESEIYWLNPTELEKWENDFGMSGNIITDEWHEAEQKTFDRNRSLIFVKK